MPKYYVDVVAGATFWYKDAKMKILHREDGPAIEWPDGARQWWVNGKLHREDGPAVEWADGDREWWVNGVKLTKEAFVSQTQPATEMTVGEIERLLGKRVKIVK